MDLKGKVVFITGGAQGLGKMKIIAMMEKGAKVFFCDLNGPKGEETARELGQRFGLENVIFEQADITDRARFTEVFQKAVSHFGSIDIMINNAGMLDGSRWELMLNLNLVAMIVGTKLATEHMRKDKGGKGGRIINVSSAAGLYDRFAHPVYCATKHGVRTYTSSLAMQPDLANQGIEYAVICPEATATELVLNIDESRTQHFAYIKDKLAVEALMRPEQVSAAFVEFLQQENINGHIQSIGKDYIGRKALEVVKL